MDSSSGGFVVLLVIGCLVAAAIAFFRGPAKRGEAYIQSLAAGIADPNDSALLLSLYQQKGSKNVVLAWVLTAFLSPTVAYIYIGDLTKAAIAFFTLQGLGVWWVISWFTMPTEVLAKNRKVADEALTQLRLMRPELKINVLTQVLPDRTMVQSPLT